MTKDTGNWLSAEQAVMPDGTERENLSLINKKLPTLASLPAGSAAESGDQAEQAPSDAGR